MAELTKEFIGKFVDAVVEHRQLAEELLLKRPDLLNARWIHGETVLHFLAVEGYVEAVKFLAEHGADVNVVNEFGDPPLIDIATLANDEIAEILLQRGADPNATSLVRDNVLHTAIRSGNARLVELLLLAGANPHYRTDSGEGVLDAIPQSDSGSMLDVLSRFGILD